MNTEKIGTFITKKRKEKNMTQKELASKIGVTDRAVSKWERGLGCPDVSLLDELSKELNISIVELLKGEEIEHPEIMEKDIIDSMKYSHESTTEKIKKIINRCLSIMIVFLCVILIIYNLLHSYMLNKTYNMVSLPTTIHDTIKNVETYSTIILKSQGIYTDWEYKILKEYAETIKTKFNDKTKEYLFKENYTMKDYYTFKEYYETNLQDIYYDNTSKYTEYFILLKYDTNIVDNMLKYQSSQEFINRSSFDLAKTINNSYKYTNHMINIYNPVTILNRMYHQEEMLLKDIIEVGELYE